MRYKGVQAQQQLLSELAVGDMLPHGRCPEQVLYLIAVGTGAEAYFFIKVQLKPKCNCVADAWLLHMQVEGHLRKRSTAMSTRCVATAQVDARA